MQLQPPPPRRASSRPSRSSQAEPLGLRRVPSTTTARLTRQYAINSLPLPGRQVRAKVPVSTTRTRPTGPSPMKSEVMPQASLLELALQEADNHGIQDDQLLLRRANVSPFLTSSLPPSSTQPPLAMLDLDLSSPSPRFGGSSSRRANRHDQAGHTNAMEMAPLHLDLCGPPPVSHSSSWHDFSLLSDAASHQNNLPMDTFPPTTNTWDDILGGPSATRHGGGLPFAYAHALKTPTSANMAAFPGFSDTHGPSACSLFHDDPAALSPTHIDRKVLVTESDLKLFSSDALFRPVPVNDSLAHGYEITVYEMGSRRSSGSSHSKRQKVSPQQQQQQQQQQQAPGYPNKSPVPSTKGKRSCPHHQGNDETAPAAASRRRLISPAPYRPYPPTRARTPLRRLPELPSTASAAPYARPMADEVHQWKPCHYSPQERAEPTNKMQPKLVRGRAIPMTPVSGGTIKQETFRANDSSSSRRLGSSTTTTAGKLARRGGATPAKRKIGIYSPEARRERIRRFHEKRKHRVFHKRIKYDCRKRLANACPRVKGRFVRKEDLEAAAGVAGSEQGDQDILSADATTPTPTTTTDEDDADAASPLTDETMLFPSQQDEAWATGTLVF